MSRKITVTKLAGFFEFVLSQELGIAILLGTVPAPDATEIAEMVRSCNTCPDIGIRVSGGTPIYQAESALLIAEPIEEIIHQAGGWEHITAAFRSYKETYPRQWIIISDHAMMIRKGGILHDGEGGMMKQMEERHKMSQRALRRFRNKILRMVALYVLSWTPKEFKLMSTL